MNVYKQQFKNFEIQRRDIISEYEVLLSILNAFTVGTEEHYPKHCNVKDAKGLSDPLSRLQYHFTLRGCKS